MITINGKLFTKNQDYYELPIVKNMQEISLYISFNRKGRFESVEFQLHSELNNKKYIIEGTWFGSYSYNIVKTFKIPYCDKLFISIKSSEIECAEQGNVEIITKK